MIDSAWIAALGVAVMITLSVLIAVLFVRLAAAKAELLDRADDADRYIRRVRQSLKDYEGGLGDRVATKKVDADAVNARAVTAGTVSASDQVRTRRVAIDGASLSMVAPTGEPADKLPQPRREGFEPVAAESPPPPAPPAKPAPDSGWMYMVDPAGSRLYRGGLAASTAWFREGVQIPTGACLTEANGGRGKVCFESAGANGAAVRVWDSLKTDRVDVGGVRMSASEDGALVVNGPISTLSSMSADRGFYAKGPPGGEPIAARLNGAGVSTAGLIEDPTRTGDLRVFSKNAVALSLADPKNPAAVEDSLVARKDGTWAKRMLTVSKAGGGGVAVADDGSVQFSVDDASPAASWRASVWERALSAGSSFLIEAIENGGKKRTTVLSATTGGVGVMLPNGVSPVGALDVGGDARVAGRFCVGSACVKDAEFASIAALPASQAVLSMQLSGQRAEIGMLSSGLKSSDQNLSSLAAQVAALQDQLARLKANGEPQQQPQQPVVVQQVQQQAQQPQPQPIVVQQAQQPRPILDYDASTLPASLVGTPVTSWPNTGELSGSSYAALGSGDAVPTLKIEKGRAFVAMTSKGSFAIPGSISWSLQSSGASFVAIAVARVNATSAPSTLVEFAAGSTKDSIVMSQDGGGQLVGAFYPASGGSPAAQVATAVPGGVVAPSQWAIYAVRATPTSAGYSITLYVNGVVSTTGTGTAALADRVTTVNLVNASSAGAAGASVDLAELQVFNSPGATDAFVSDASRALAAKWVG